MNRVMLMIFSLLTLGKAATIQEIGSYSHNGRMMGPQNSEAGVMVNHLQNKMAADAMYGTKGEDCGAKDNRLSDGIYVPQADPVTEHLERIQKQQQCLIAKAKTQKAIEDTMKRVVKETTKQAANDFQKNLEKKNCVNKLDRANHECFVKDVLKDFYTAVVWKVAVHDNVAQLWYHDKLVLMLVFETIDYNVKPEEQECFTFFPTSNVAAEENALGHVVNVIGKPATPKSATQGECRPCTDFLKKTVEGTASKCTNNCDPSNILFSGSNFKTKKGSTSTVAPTEARNKGGKED